MKILMGVELSDNQFDSLMCEQAKGKELKLIDNTIVAVEHIPADYEKLQIELQTLLDWFNEYDNQIMQFHRALRLGTAFDKDINVLDSQAIINQNRIKEIRNILNIKKP